MTKPVRLELPNKLVTLLRGLRHWCHLFDLYGVAADLHWHEWKEKAVQHGQNMALQVVTTAASHYDWKVTSPTPNAIQTVDSHYGA